MCTLELGPLFSQLWPVRHQFNGAESFLLRSLDHLTINIKEIEPTIDHHSCSLPTITQGRVLHFYLMGVLVLSFLKFLQAHYSVALLLWYTRPKKWSYNILYEGYKLSNRKCFIISLLVTSLNINPSLSAEGALAGVQGCIAPPFFQSYHIAPPNFEQLIHNVPKDQWVTLISNYPIKLCTLVFKFLTHTLISLSYFWFYLVFMAFAER